MSFNSFGISGESFKDFYAANPGVKKEVDERLNKISSDNLGELASAINSGRISEILPKAVPLTDNDMSGFTVEAVHILGLKILCAKESELISNTAAVDALITVALFEDQLVRPYDTVKQMNFNPPLKVDEEIYISILMELRDRNTLKIYHNSVVSGIKSISLCEQVPEALLRVYRAHPPYFPKTVSYHHDEEDFMKYIKHFFGLWEHEMDEVRGKLKTIPMSECTLSRIEIHSDLQQWSKVLQVQSRIYNSSLRGTGIVKKKYNPVLRSDSNTRAAHYILIIPSVTVFQCLNHMRFEDNQLYGLPADKIVPKFIIESEVGNLLPTQFFIDCFGKGQRPVQVPLPGNGITPPDSIDTNFNSLKKVAVTMHDLWHVMDLCNSSRGAKKMSGLMANAVSDIGLKASLVDGDIGYRELYTKNSLYIPGELLATVDEYLEKFTEHFGWTDSDLSEIKKEIAKDMVVNQKEWMSEIGYDWRSLPKTSGIYQYAKSFSIDSNGLVDENEGALPEDLPGISINNDYMNNDSSDESE